jgi:HPt (histidine-containing phosphotransfer) domain-containing protein
MVDFIDEDKELQKKLYLIFVKSNQNLYADITEAISVGDTKLAHRLVHTLKGNAGMIGKMSLQDIAGEIETLLGTAAEVSQEKMKILESELSAVLEELKPLLD